MFGIGPCEADVVTAVAVFLALRHLANWPRDGSHPYGSPPLGFAVVTVEPILPGKPLTDEPPEWFIQDQP